MAGNKRLRANAVLGALAVTMATMVAGVPPAQAAAATCPSPVVDSAPVSGNNHLGYKYINHFAAVPGTDDAYAVGGDEEDDFNNPGVPSVPLVKHWDGSSWASFTAPSPSGFTSGAEALAVDAPSTNDIWVAGVGTTDGWTTFTGWVAHWTGASWATTALEIPAQTDTVTITDIEEVASDDVWIVGYRHDSVSGDQTGIAYHYTGSSWSIDDTIPASFRLFAIDAVSANDVWAVGRGGTSSSGGSYTMHWDGVHGWQTVASPDPTGFSGQLNGVVALGAGDVWAVGGEFNNSLSYPVARHWNGSSWSAQKVPPFGNGAFLSDVVATTAGDIWAAGGGAPAQAGQLAHFDGSAWTVVPAGDASGSGVDYTYTNAIVATRDHIWAGGSSSVNDAVMVPMCGLTTSVAGADGSNPAITTTDTVDTDHPIQTSVDLPSTLTGDVKIRETYSKRVVADIEMPTAASAASPTVVKFFLHHSRYIGAVRTGSLVVKDGAVVPPCTGDGAGATPDPCVASDDGSLPNGHSITVNTTTGGIWTVSQQRPTASLTYTSALTTKPVATFNDAVGGVGAYTAGVRNFFMSAAGVQVPTDVPVCKDEGSSPIDCAQYGVRSAQYIPSSPLMPGQTYRIDVNPPGEIPIADANNVPVAPTSATFRASRAEEESSVAAKYTWPRVSASAAYGGSYVRSRSAGTSATYRFNSSGVRWYTVTGPSMGKAIVRIDGVTKCTCDLYTTSTHFHASRYFGGLANGNHTLQITATGTKRAASTNTYVAVDSFLPDFSSQDMTPPLTYQWQRIAASNASGGHLSRFDTANGAFTFTFKGTGIRWYTLRGPAEGKAKVYVDGVLKDTYDAYRATKSIAYRAYATSNGIHTLKIVVLGTKNAASKGSYVTVDRLFVL